MGVEDADTITVGLLAALNDTIEPMLICDPHRPNMPIVAVSAPFTALSGYTADELLGHNCRFLQGPETDRDTILKIGVCIRQRQGCIQWLQNYRKDGSVFWNLLFISPVYDRNGRLLYFFSNQHDLSGKVPHGLDCLSRGSAHLALPQQMEFHDLLNEMGQRVQRTRAKALEQVRALEATLADTRQIAFRSTRLELDRQV